MAAAVGRPGNCPPPLRTATNCATDSTAAAPRGHRNGGAGMAGRMGRRGMRAALGASLVVGVGIVAAPAGASTRGVTSTCGTTALITVDPDSGQGGTLVTVSGTGFCPDTGATIFFQDAAGTRTPLGRKAIGADGTLSIVVAIPVDAAPGYGSVRASDLGGRQCPWAEFEVTQPG